MGGKMISVRIGILSLMIFCNVVYAKTAPLLSHAELHKMASTGMPLGKYFQVSSKLNFVSQYYLCNPTKCDSKYWINIEDDQLSTKEKRDLYDLRDKVGCFTVRMLNDGHLYLSAFSQGVDCGRKAGVELT